MKNAFILAGTASHVGKTTVTAAVLKCFVDKGLDVQAMKCGPDYLDPTFHRFVTGRPSINIDLHLMGEKGLKERFYKHAEDVDVVVIEGVMGLYDGWDHTLDNGSAAHLSRLLGVPVILIVDGSGISTSVAAMVKGHAALDPRVNIAGVILNQVGSEAHAALLKEAIGRYTQIPVMGYLVRQSGFSLESRHLGLKPAHEVADLTQQLEVLAEGAKESLDLDGLRALVLLEPECQPHAVCLQEPAATQRPYRVAYAYDDAFYFYYQDNLDMMRDMGMELVPFSPLSDSALPEGTESIYLGGGYPELFAQKLSENFAMLKAIRSASAEGMPIYGECGGMMYLAQTLEDMQGNSYPMVGALKGKSHMTNRLQHFGYVDVVVEEAGIFPAGARLKGHEFHRATTQWQSEQPLIYRVEKAFNFSGSSRGWNCGAQSKFTLGAYAHVHFVSAPEVLTHWVAVMEKRRDEEERFKA